MKDYIIYKINNMLNFLKGINITPGIAARIVVYALLAVWFLAFAQRAKVIGDSPRIDFDFTNITQVKYLVGLSFSAEQYQAVLDYADRLERFEEMRKRRDERSEIIERYRNSFRPTFRR